MDDTFGSDSVPADKTRILTVKPLRILIPVFPSPQDPSLPPSSQYASVPPTGPFPPGAAPFFPFFSTTNPPKQPPNPNPKPYFPSPVPLNSFRTPPSNGDIGTSKRTSKHHVDEDGYSQSQSDGYSDYEDKIKTPVTRKKHKTGTGIAVSNSDIDIDPFVTHLLTSFNLSEIDTFRQSDSDKELVDRVISVFNLLRRKISQLDDTTKKDSSSSSGAKRPDLRAGTICMNKGARANVKKRIGHVPGVEIGDIFFFRFEMCLIGLHAPSMAGIDYLTLKKNSGTEEPIAVSIVSAGGYEDEQDDGDVLIYSGQGGAQTKGKPQTDQQLIRGNLALEKSLHRGNEVRVIRGLKDYQNPTGKIYVYDGLYKIVESWVEKGKSGCNVFKYKLIRVPNQPPAFTLWKQIQQWKDSNSLIPRNGVILPDLTSGAEKYPVSLVNDVDHEKGPAYFTYTRALKYRNPFPLITQKSSCSSCIGGCQPGNNCCCVEKNGGYLPYSSLGILLSHNSLIHECGRSCNCSINCRNRVSQSGLKVRLEVFKTTDRGWGLRSWDPIRAGGFVCEYGGVVVGEEGINNIDDGYVFDSTRVFDAVETVPSAEVANFPYPLVISAKNEGNVGRFMNHSCMPNVYWQPVIREGESGSYFHVGFYAIRHIPPMQELTFNYGMVRGETSGSRKKRCLCGSARCKGFFY